MKTLVLIALATVSFSILATDSTTDTKTSFSCMDKQTFEVDAKCISTSIETNDKFEQSQQAFYQEASQPGDYVMATLLMDPVTLDITVIGHTEKALVTAKADIKD